MFSFSNKFMRLSWKMSVCTNVTCSGVNLVQNLAGHQGEARRAELRVEAVSRPKFTILWGLVEDISLHYKFFSDCRYVP